MNFRRYRHWKCIYCSTLRILFYIILGIYWHMTFGSSPDTCHAFQMNINHESGVTWITKHRLSIDRVTCVFFMRFMEMFVSRRINYGYLFYPHSLQTAHATMTSHSCRHQNLFFSDWLLLQFCNIFFNSVSLENIFLHLLSVCYY